VHGTLGNGLTSHYPVDKQQYNYYFNKLKSTLKKHKNNLYACHPSPISLTPQIWIAEDKNQITFKIQNCHSPSSLPKQQPRYHTPREKSDLLATHLANRFKPQDISPYALHLLRVEQFISSPLPMALPASPTSLGEVLSVIKKLKKNKSPGHGGKNNAIVENLPPKTIILLTYIFNAMFRLSCFPTTWKLALIITIPKPEKPSDTPETN